MNIDSLIEEIEQIAVPFIEEIGAELIDLKASYSGKIMTIVILTDKPQGGITIGECSRLNKLIGGVIEEKALINQEYSLEVSSPGLDRPLTTSKDFQRVLTREVCLFLSEPIEGRVEYRGVVQEADEEKIVVVVDGEARVSVPIEKINKAIQVI